MSDTTTATDVTPESTTNDAPAEVAAKSAATAPKTESPAAAATGKEKAEEKVAEEKRFKIKVNGKERVVDEKTAIAYLQRELAADEKFRSASAEAKKVESILKMAKEDPDKLLRELTGQDPVEIYKKRIGDEIRKMAMTPEQRELEEAKQKLLAYERKEQERIEQEKKLSQERAKDFYVKKYDNEIPAALKSAGLPVNEDTVRYTAEVMLANLEEGLDLPYELVMDLVKEKYQKSVRGFISASDREKLIDLLGEDVVDQIIEARQKKKNPPKAVQRQAVPDGSDSDDGRPKAMNKEEFQEYVKRWTSQ